MTFLLDATLRSSAILAVALIAVRLLHRQSAAVRHAVLAVALALAGLVAPLGRALPAWSVAVPAAVASSAPVPLAIAPPEGQSTDGVGPVSWPPALAPLLFGVWAAGATAGLVLLVSALAQLRRVSAQGRSVTDGPRDRIAREVAIRAGLRRPVTLVVSNTADVPATWGVVRPRILLPAQSRDWGEARIRVVLGHEIAHIVRHDWLIQVLVEGLRALYWFNPLFWWACRRLRHESEHAADDAVLRGGVEPCDYAQHLLDVARNCRRSMLPVAGVVPMARRSALEWRITAMLNPHLARTGLSPRALALIIVALLGLALPISALRATQDGPRPLSGVVYDPSGAVLPEVALTLEDERQNKWQATSDSAGRFEFPPVAAGHYTLGVSLPGFRALSQDVDLKVARDWARAVTLQVGVVQETITIRQQRAKAPRSGPQPGLVPVRVGGNIRPPTKLHDVRPIYPESMREAGLEGMVPLEAIIGRDGSVVSVRVVTAQVHPDLAQAAVDAVRQWRFSPTLLNGTPVEVVMTVSMAFQLEE